MDIEFHPVSPGPSDLRLFSAQETAMMLGIHVETLYRLVARREIGYVQIGRRHKHSRQQISDYIREREVPPL